MANRLTEKSRTLLTELSDFGGFRTEDSGVNRLRERCGENRPEIDAIGDHPVFVCRHGLMAS